MPETNGQNPYLPTEETPFPFESYVAHEPDQPVAVRPAEAVQPATAQVAPAQAAQVQASQAEETPVFVPQGQPVAGQAAQAPEAPIQPTVRPVSLGGPLPSAGTPVGTVADDDLEALGAYKALEARNKRRRRKRIAIGTVIGALALAGFGWFIATNFLATPPEEIPTYDVAYVTTETYENSVSASGAIKPASQYIVAPEVEGIISEVMVAEGDSVLKGDIIYTLKNDALDKAIQDAEQALKSAENGVISAEKSLDTANTSLVRAQDNYNKVFATLYETQEIADAAGAEATDMLNSAQNLYDEAQLSLDNARIAVTTAQEGVDNAKANADKRTVRAPESGDVITMNAEVGASVGGSIGSGSNNTLVTIADLSKLRVSVQVNEVDINYLQQGQEAEVSFSALNDLVLTAVVEHIAKVSSGSDQQGAGGIVTYDVDLVIENPDPQVKPGMTARVRVLTDKIENALTVPVSALQMISENEAQVFVDSNYSGEGTPAFEERTVKVVAQDSTIAVVEGDIADGDAVQLLVGDMEDESGVTVEVG
ncbi:MAG: efflux RND transporter periplasmic adaptor subunit [Eggerthellaceae bacterium]|nr:efflux RND transporter periplasmic adaptor subunit [Eggerthellaceae bacterium]